ncbi:hypothetical protein BC828DRAFT_405668 [Blastocladiella britannica]|nr:hypothetical protein BC828DRAFT_405668 [Blastocladiella britannica]
MDQLPYELVEAIVSHAMPSACLAAALPHYVAEPHVIVAWAHSLVAANDDSFLDDRPSYDALRMYDTYHYPDTRGLAAPASWYMRRLVTGLRQRETSTTAGKTVELVVPPHAFQVPAVLDYLLSKRQFAMIAGRQLNHVVAEWDVPFVEYDGPALDDDVDNYTFAPSPELAARLAAHELRLVPEALQLPTLLLYSWNLPNFQCVVRSLVAGIPSLTTAVAPIRLWLRLGIDDRLLIRNSLSICAGEDVTSDGLEELITLPMVWALLAAAEGRVNALEFVIEATGINVGRLIEWFSLQGPSRTIMHSFKEIPGAGRALPMWQWLRERGYTFPYELNGLLMSFISCMSDYEVALRLFLDHDLPILRDIEHVQERDDRYGRHAWDMIEWVVLGRYEMLEAFNELGMMNPKVLFEMIRYICDTERYGVEHSLSPKEVLAAVAEICTTGFDEAIQAGFDEGVDDAVKIAFMLSDRFADLIVERADEPELLSAVLALPSEPLFLSRFASCDPVPWEWTRGALPAHGDATSDAHLVHVVAMHLIDSMSPQARIDYFISSTLSPKTLRSLETAFTVPADAPAGWPVQQYILDKILPAELEGTAATVDLGASQQIQGMVMAGATWASKFAELDHPWSTATSDLTSAGIAALAVPSAQIKALAPVWALARLAVLAPATVVSAIKYSNKVAPWLWTLRLSVVQQGAMPLPAKLSRWTVIVARLMQSKKDELARIVMHNVVAEAPTPKTGLARVVTGMASKYPAVLEYVLEADPYLFQ